MIKLLTDYPIVLVLTAPPILQSLCFGICVKFQILIVASLATICTKRDFAF